MFLPACNSILVESFVMDPIVCKKTALKRDRLCQLLRVVVAQHLLAARGHNVEAACAQNIRNQDRDILIQIEGGEEFQGLAAGCTR